MRNRAEFRTGNLDNSDALWEKQSLHVVAACRNRYLPVHSNGTDMIFLALNILFSSAFTLFIKWVTVRKQEDIITVGPINYITAALLVAPQFFLQGAEPQLAAVICGSCMGVIYFTAFFFVSFAIRNVGAAPTTVVGGLSLLLPILVAAFLWEETPNTAQWFGIGFAVLALTLIGVRRKKPTEPQVGEKGQKPIKTWVTPVVLVAFFLLAGSARLTQRTLKHVIDRGPDQQQTLVEVADDGSNEEQNQKSKAASDPDDQRATFLFAAFMAASIPSIILLICRAKKISLAEISIGAGMGTSNILQSYFILKALEQFAGYIVFPISSAGGLILTTFVATRLLAEKLNRQTYVGIAVAVIALVLLNWVGA